MPLFLMLGIPVTLSTKHCLLPPTTKPPPESLLSRSKTPLKASTTALFPASAEHAKTSLKWHFMPPKSA